MRAEPERLSAALLDRFGMRFNAHQQATHARVEEPQLHVVLADLHATDGFGIRVTRGWHHLRAEFVPGSYARPLLQEMTRADAAMRETAAVFASAERGVSIDLQLDQAPVDPRLPGTWPSQWEAFELSSRLQNVDDDADSDVATASVLSVAAPLIGFVLALLPVEEEIAEMPSGLPEGAVQRVEVNRYERSRFNRAACIAAKGTACRACGFDFGSYYGPMGTGFIHVHHTTPVSRIGPDYRVNPVRDLEPVCPNCHAMLHRENPPMTVEQLREVIERGQPD